MSEALHTRGKNEEEEAASSDSTSDHTASLPMADSPDLENHSVRIAPLAGLIVAVVGLAFGTGVAWTNLSARIATVQASSQEEIRVLRVEEAGKWLVVDAKLEAILKAIETHQSAPK